MLVNFLFLLSLTVRYVEMGSGDSGRIDGLDYDRVDGQTPVF